MKNKLIYLFLLTINSVVFAQELIERNLTYNPYLNPPQKFNSNFFYRSRSLSDTISLGLNGWIEDFSSIHPYPDSALWLDSMVYINRGYAISPPSIGVATFDGLNKYGYPYDFYADNNNATPADTLTSKPIDLNYPVSDSIYLSFYYQRQGLGNDPQKDDSLVLELKSPNNINWVNVWSSEGGAILSDTIFKLVMIPITDIKFLKKGFQFRFRNYATPHGNWDHWNIDNIYINRLRGKNDTITNDISWVYNGTSLLKSYKAMPWKQFTTGELSSTIYNVIKNNDSILRNVSYKYKTYSSASTIALDSFSGNSNLYPFTKSLTYTDCDINLGCIKTAPLATTGMNLTAPAKFSIVHYFVTATNDFSIKNDTLLVTNNLTNYFAYDDGTAESAIGLNANEASLALKFTLTVSDTLSGLDMFFNPLEVNAELYGISLTLWDNFLGAPGNIIYTTSNIQSPVYENAGQNIFTRYYFEPQLLQAGTYYIGFIQKTDQLLNVGLDKNNDNSKNLFFNVGNGWQNSTQKGSVLIRPLFGELTNPNSINTITNKIKTYELYPNPVVEKLYINNTIINVINYTIYDIAGKQLITGIYNYEQGVNVEILNSGFYTIEINNGQQRIQLKFVKQ